MFAVLFLGVIGVFIVIIFVQRSKYKNKSNGTAFFFEGDELVLNSLLPYPVKISDIDRVELLYNAENLEAVAGSYVNIKVVKNDGKERTVGYKVNKFDAQTHPSQLKETLVSHGIRCVDPQAKEESDVI